MEAAQSPQNEPKKSQAPDVDLANAKISPPAQEKAPQEREISAAPGQVQVQRPSASTQSPVQVEAIDEKSLVSSQKSMLDMLKRVPDGQKYVAEAEQLGAKITLGNLQTILEHGQAARDALSAIANEMVGDRRLGDAGPIQELFTSLSNYEKQLNISEVSAPKSFMTKLLTSLPFGMGSKFEPVYRFFERFKKLKPEIDSKEQNLKELEVGRTKSQNELRGLQETVLEGFRSLEVSIAAGEIALKRELGKFEQDRKGLQGSDDVVALQELKNRRLAITNLDNRLMRLQTARADAIMDLPVIDMAIDNEEKLRANLEDLRTVTIPQIRKAVAIAIRIHDQREAAQLAGGIQELNAALREANLTALGMAQQETHKVATQASREVEHLVKCMGKMSELVKTGNELLSQNKQMNEEARLKLREAEEKFKKDIEASLQDLPA